MCEDHWQRVIGPMTIKIHWLAILMEYSRTKCACQSMELKMIREWWVTLSETLQRR